MKLLKEEKNQEYCEVLKEFTENGNKLEPFYSFDLHSDHVLYIPSSDILFLKEYLLDSNSIRIVAYNIEYGTWSYSKKVKQKDINNNDLVNLLLEAFAVNLHFMMEKIKYAINNRDYSSIFVDGERFKPTLRGINTNLQKEIELKCFKAKVEKIFSPDEENKSVLSNLCDEIISKWNIIFNNSIQSINV